MKQGISCSVILVLVAGIGVIGMFGAASALAVGLQPQEISGTVKFAVAAGSAWVTLTKDITIQTGYMIQTGPLSVVTLHAEDGSVIFLGENTQLSVVSLESSSGSRPRELRLNLLRGTITIEAVQSTVKDERIEIETPLVIAKVVNPHEQDTRLQVAYLPTTPECHVYNFKGQAAFLQMTDGHTDFTGLFGEQGEKDEGLTVPINKKGADVTMAVLPGPATIIVHTNFPVDQLTALLGDYIGMETTNLDEDNRAPIYLFRPGKKEETSLNKKGQKLTIVTASANVVKVSAPVWLYGKFHFFKDFGTDGFLLLRDGCDCVETFWGEEQGGTTPKNEVVPPVPPPQDRPKESAGSPILP